VDGSIATLELIFKQLKRSHSALGQLLEWTLYADTLVPVKGGALLDSVLEYLLALTKLEETRDEAWRVIIVGWHIFIRTTEQ